MHSDDKLQRDQRVWRVVEAIPPGFVATYGQVADLAGLGRGARQIGPALGRASDPNLPWHRVVAAQGRIAIPSGPSRERQIARLHSEGVVCVGGRVNMRHYQWQPSLDELLWKL